MGGRAKTRDEGRGWGRLLLDLEEGVQQRLGCLVVNFLLGSMGVEDLVECESFLSPDHNLWLVDRHLHTSPTGLVNLVDPNIRIT